MYPNDPNLKLLYGEKEIAKRVKEMAKEISRDYAGKSVHIICVLKGGVTFLADLIREMTVPVTMDFFSVSSYSGSTESSGVVRITKDLDDDIESKHVIILEDIVDTGLTLNYIKNNVSSRKVASLALATFLDRPHRRKVKLDIDYTGFVIPDVYVVGYGLDFGQKHRQYKAVYAMTQLTNQAI